MGVKKMLKILGSIIIIAGATVIGFTYSSIFLQRVKQLRDMQYALNMMETEIAYTATPLIEVLFSVGEKSSNIIKKIFVGMAETLRSKKKNSVYEAFIDTYTQLKGDIYLDKEEIGVISAFMQSLGGSDIEGQKKNINITIKKLEGFEKRAEEIRTKNEKLYRYLGVSFGVLIVIILV
jgi:stage III sporulation protein AB